MTQQEVPLEEPRPQDEKKKAFKRKTSESLVNVFLVEIARVLDEDHVPVYRLMHDLRDASFRMFNAAMRGCVLVPKDVHPATHAYREINRALEDYRTWNATMYDKTGEEHFRRRMTLDVPSDMRAYASNLVGRAYLARRKEIDRGEVSIPSYKKNGPLHVSKNEWTLVRDERDVNGEKKQGLVLEAKIRGGRSAWTRFAVVPCGPTDHANVKILMESIEVLVGLEQAYKAAKKKAKLAGVVPSKEMRAIEKKIEQASVVDRCDLKLIFDDDRRKWFAKIAFRRPRPVAAGLDPNKKIAVHRGIRTFLTWACDAHVGVATQELHDGGTFLKWKARQKQMAAALRKSLKHPGSGAKGHGTRRRLQAYSAFEETQRNAVKTLCQQLAAKVVGVATKFGAGTLVIEDYSARDFADEMAKYEPHFARIIREFPLYVLRTCMEGAAERAGIKVELVPAFYESCTCPSCGNVDLAQDDKRGNFRCSSDACGLKRSVEAVAAWNMLKMAGDPKAFAKAKERLEKQLGDLVAAAKKSSE